MSHPLIDQFRFTRREWLRGLEGVSEKDGTCHFGRMNSISWIVGHLAWQEQRTWLTRPQKMTFFPQLNELVAHGAPMTTPSFREMLEIWHTVTEASDPFLDTLTTKLLQSDLPLNGESSGQSIGSAMRRVTYHYWYHVGEVQAIRQLLDHRDLPQYVGNIEVEAPYRPE
jgi:hypothetical protein